MSRYLIAFAISLLALGCGGHTNEPGIGQGVVVPPQSCDLSSQQQFVVEVMNDTYFWYDQVPSIDIEQFETLEQTLDALKVPNDRFSYITTQEANDNFFEEGTFEGFGFRSIINEARDAYIIGYTFTDSPSGMASWQRADRILAINSVSSSEIIAGEGINHALAGLNVGDTATFTLQKRDNSVSDIVLTKAVVRMNTVLTTQVVETETNTIGYIALSSFIENTTDEFSTAVDSLTEANINELVLDLRYNGGGRVNASRNVASMIGGSHTNGFDYSRTIHNDKYTSSNSTNPFNNFSNALNLSRVYVLTTAATCSASELVINSLSPFVNVVVVGGTTCGKPVGMYGKSFCDQIILPIEFQSVNNEGYGDYFDGLVADCSSVDDLSRDFADPQEGMFSTAIFHMENSTCPPLSSDMAAKQLKPLELIENWSPQRQNN